LFTLASMTKRFLTLFFAIGFASICAVQAQSPTPGESPAGAPSPAKHRTHKKTQTTASPAETAASPASSPKAKRGRKKAEAGTAETAASPLPVASPAAAPKAKGTRKKAETATSPSPSPAKFSLGDLFKPKSSAATSPAAMSGAAAKSTSAEAGANPPAPGGGHGLVWVNTDSHVYHREGSRFYGTTKKGKYMTEAEAMKEGNRAAGKGQ
jgi:membrane protein involved in colicin uptake